MGKRPREAGASRGRSTHDLTIQPTNSLTYSSSPCVDHARDPDDRCRAEQRLHWMQRRGRIEAPLHHAPGVATANAAVARAWREECVVVARRLIRLLAVERDAFLHPVTERWRGLLDHREHLGRAANAQIAVR